ncbi:hypothetical protein ABIE69_000167 [Rhodobacteraceae bacterium MBR-64]|jgi:hypothetical protein
MTATKADREADIAEPTRDQRADPGFYLGGAGMGLERIGAADDPADDLSAALPVPAGWGAA